MTDDTDDIPENEEISEEEREARLMFEAIMEHAEAGHSEAQTQIGLRYLKGYGTEEDHKEAVKWIRRAADQENPDAQYFLGHCYMFGKGVNESSAQAVKWYRKSAKQGHRAGMYELGTCYLEGEGVKENLRTACGWLEKAAQAGQGDAAYDLARLYLLGQETDYDPDKAVGWLTVGADLGHDQCQHLLGLCCRDGKGTEKNPMAAIKWLGEAAEQGNAKAALALADLYASMKSGEQADFWYEKAAEGDDQKAWQVLAGWKLPAFPAAPAVSVTDGEEADVYSRNPFEKPSRPVCLRAGVWFNRNLSAPLWCDIEDALCETPRIPVSPEEKEARRLCMLMDEDGSSFIFARYLGTKQGDPCWRLGMGVSDGEGLMCYEAFEKNDPESHGESIIHDTRMVADAFYDFFSGQKQDFPAGELLCWYLCDPLVDTIPQPTREDGNGAAEEADDHGFYGWAGEDTEQDIFYRYDRLGYLDLRAKAGRGDGIAQAALAQRYLTGDGCPKSPVRAVFWNRQAAENGSAKACNDLGNLYAYGYALGVKRDWQKAEYYYALAAKQGVPFAVNSLACLLRDRGLGDVAMKLFDYASRFMGEARLNIGEMLFRGYQASDGTMVPPDYKAAYELFSDMSESSDETGWYVSECFLSVMRYLGLGTESDEAMAIGFWTDTYGYRPQLGMFMPVIDRLYKEEFGKKITEAKSGNPRDLYGVGLCYVFGAFGCPVDKEKAKVWMRKAAAAGDKDAASWLAFNSDKNSPESYVYYAEAIRKGDTAAMMNLANDFSSETDSPEKQRMAYALYEGVIAGSDPDEHIAKAAKETIDEIRSELSPGIYRAVFEQPVLTIQEVINWLEREIWTLPGS